MCEIRLSFGGGGGGGGKKIFFFMKCLIFSYFYIKKKNLHHYYRGDSASPAFGDLRDYHLFFLRSRTPKSKLRDQWGHELLSEEDVWRVFQNFIIGCKNEYGVKVRKFRYRIKSVLFT